MLRRASLIIGTVLMMATSSVAMAQGQRGQGQGGQGQGGRGQRPGQGGPQGFGAFGGGGLMGLLGMPEVLKEIAATDEQKGLIDDLVKDQRAAGRGGGGFNPQEFQNLSEEERRKRFEELRKQGEERAKKTEDTIKTILEPKQFARLNELRIQQEGVRALDRAEVAEKLGLSKEQKDKIAKIREESRPQGGGAGFGNRGNQSQEERQKAAEEARQRREKSNADILAVLTASQKESFEKMQGKKFEFPAPQGRRPGGGADR